MARKRGKRKRRRVDEEYMPTPEEIEAMCAEFRRQVPRRPVGVSPLTFLDNVIPSRIAFPQHSRKERRT